MRGRHQSTCKKGKKAIDALKKVPGVKTVIIGPSVGGKGLHQATDGTVKLQNTLQGCIKAVMQTSKGVQNLSILLEDGLNEEDMKQALKQLPLVE
ncbi:MAG TPA: hypothetical protein DHW71_10560 [Gammaproteobacteria bacterium]|nr:hypothetical protein [Gammaproteobacteria bacterium]MEC8010192.1 DUF2103 domain-containing protein [Pseudomonadota bacterium]HBF09573.1 hypothetical protein [Gammaproteobacteria bacterium]HCK93422.1 hypothetical protein [Gammaproteobacteria bacterium]|tara:strand:- start:440 stop:724 length:285 start_codon:yes stop_codon:yes gene_type:complete